MNRISIQTTVDFVDAVKKANYGELQTIEVPFSISLENFTTDQRVYFELYLVFHTKYNYTTVASKTVTPNTSREDWGSPTKGETLKFISCHDSCWRDGAERAIKDFEKHIDHFMEDKYGSEWQKTFYMFDSHGFGIRFRSEELETIRLGNKVFCTLIGE